MGLFSGFRNRSKDLKTIAKATSVVLEMLDEFDQGEYDESDLAITAWICRSAILNIIERNEWPPYFIAFVPIRGNLTKMTLLEIQLATINRLSTFVSKLNDKESETLIQDILDGGSTFEELDSEIDQDVRDVIFKD